MARRSSTIRRLSSFPAPGEIFRGEGMRATIVAAVLAASCGLGVPGGEARGQGLPAHGGPAAAAAQPATTGTFTGRVLETMDSGGYTYLKLSTADGERWAAVSPAAVKVGGQVSIVNAFVVDDFEARSLGRKFDHIIFGTLGATRPGSPHGDGAMAASPHGDGTIPVAPHGGGAMPVAPHGGNREKMEDAGSIPKLEGAEGRTVAEVWAQRLERKDKPVAVRGKVVKFNGGIMGRNWLHLQDGTGSEEASNFDLTVTTHDDATVGDVVVVRGVVHVDADFGAGYTYPVIVEDATIER
jgi:hypothetical protein